MKSELLPKAVTFSEGRLFILDQTKLPKESVIIELKDIEEVWDGIKTLKVRGAPAIGIVGAYGLLVGMKPYINEGIGVFKSKVIETANYLNSSRPTAVNLSRSLIRLVRDVSFYRGESAAELYGLLTEEAVKIHEEDMDICSRIGSYGSKLLKEGMGVLTHCNAGALAVSQLGTALAPIYIAKESGINVKVFADETRPLLQGSRLTVWELMQSSVDVTLICDNMASYVMSKGLIDIVITGCDRVASNGDTANKIGTMGVAILAKHFGIPFYIACPSSTFDPNCKDGSMIVIEERDGSEVTSFGGVETAPKGAKVLNPAFDVTPADLITGFITEKGIIKPPYIDTLQILLG